jgi:small subunit ribosomal protein S6
VLYILVDFAGLPATVKELERNFRIDDRVIRYLTTKKSDHVDLAALEAEIAAKAREAERLRAEADKASAAVRPRKRPAAPTPEAEPLEVESATTPAAEAAEAEPAIIPAEEA